MSRFPRPFLIVLGVAAALACSHDPVGVAGEEAAPGAAARVVLEAVQWAGGQGLRTTTTIDSTTATWVLTTCRESPTGTTCAATTQQLSGSTVPAYVTSLFTRARADAFRALRASYGPPPGVTPPDGSAVALTITANQLTRRIAWDGRASLPAVLVGYVCAVKVARGDRSACVGP